MPDFSQEFQVTTPCWYVHDTRTAQHPISAGRGIVNAGVDQTGAFPAIYFNRDEAEAAAKRAGVDFAPEEVSDILALVRFLEELQKAGHHSVIFIQGGQGRAYSISAALVAGTLASDDETP